jgi:hypothetical protein
MRYFAEYISDEADNFRKKMSNLQVVVHDHRYPALSGNCARFEKPLRAKYLADQEDFFTFFVNSDTPSESIYRV